MKKLYIYLIMIVCLFGNTLISYAQGQTTPAQCPQIPSSINNFINNYFKFTNEHNFTEISKIYAPNYVSGDGLKRDDVLTLMKDTWKNYPDIKMSSVVKDVRVNNDYASIETFDKSVGTSAQRSDITNDLGNLESESHNILYLQKFGKTWKIITDKTTYEKTIIKFGSAKTLKVSLDVPEQAMASENYTASLRTEVPNGMVALGSITREPIVYPETKPEETYRQINPTSGLLERFMAANCTNNNELATASVGFTEMTEDVLANPEVKLTGMAILLSRVNVIPKSTFVPQNDKLKIEPDLETSSLPEKTEK